MIVGATDATDFTILNKTSTLYNQQKLKRVYYSAYSPIPSASKNFPPISPPLVREHRLYQADWLLRFYGFKVDEIVHPTFPNLSLDLDPKLSWALRNPHFFPISLQTAAKEILLRIPGIGVQNVLKILQIRRWHQIKIADLKKLRLSLKKVLPFVEVQDHRPHKIDPQHWTTLFLKPQQLELFNSI